MGSTNLLKQLVNVPRDIEQVRNFQKAERRRIALTQDVNYNLQEIADDTKFIQEIVSYPDVAIFMYSILKKNPNAIYCQKAPYPYCRELCWAFIPNLGGGTRKKAKGGKKEKE